MESRLSSKFVSASQLVRGRRRFAFEGIPLAIKSWFAIAAPLFAVSLLAQEAPPERPERIEGANPAQQAETPTTTAPATQAWPGLQPDGRVQLPNQWSLKPVGPQLELGDFPVNIALHPQKQFAAILHAGHGTHEIIVVDTKSRTIVSRAALLQTFVGICFNHAGTRLYASGCEEELIHSFAFADGYLSDHKTIKVVDAKTRFVVTGVATSPDDSTLYACGSWGGKFAIIPLAGGEPRIIDTGEGTFPYAALPSTDGSRVFVSYWGGAVVGVIDPSTGTIKEKWTTPSHPTEMALSPDGGTLFVACANSTQVVAIDTQSGRAREIINCALYPAAPSGNTPNSLSLSKEGAILAVANADNNNIALFNVEKPGQARSLGFIPTGWYPTSVRFLPDGGLLYTNGKGTASKANREGPNPLTRAPGGIREYIGGLFRGTLGYVKPLKPAELAKYTADAYDASPLRADAAPNTKLREPNNPIPAKLGEPSPIKHCIYVIKENRTYDQVFGDIPEGNGDPHLCLFPERVTPNHHALVREFVLLDNFYVDSEVSADGHEWSMAAYATDFVEKTWPLTYRNTRPEHKKLTYPSEGDFDIAVPAGGYLWDRCKEAGVSYRNYAEWIEKGKKDGEPAVAKVPALEGHFDPHYMPYDLDYPDVKRAERFISELKRFETEGDMPKMQILRLGNDHTAGTRKGKPTPTACVAENDQALGVLVEGISKSKFWESTAIFVVEDDAQNGSDHVDAHRTVALVISPYCKRKFVDSSMYSTSSMLRTMELILGLQPMSQFDAAALPMYHSFTEKPDLTPYRHRAAQVDLNEKNLASAWGSELSETFELAKEDAVDDLVLNEVIWHSIKGPDSPMPPPVRAAFVRSSGGDDDDEGDDDDDDDEIDTD